MKTGTAYAESLACALPLDEAGMAQVKAEYGFESHLTLMSCMHLALWTRLDIITTCVVLAQYQNKPSHIHFAVVKQMVGYLRLHPDIPLTFDHSRFLNTVGSFDIEVDHLDPLQIQFLGPEVYHITSVQLLCADHAAYADLSVTAMEIPTDHDRIKFVPPYAFIPSTIADTSFGPDMHAPYTESFIDANLPGGIFKKTPPLFGFCRLNCDMATENTTEAEMTAGNPLGKALQWLHLFMDDLGLAFDGPIPPVAEDNAATRIIAHTGKLTHNVRHITLKAISLQTLVRERISMFRAIGSANN
jgi:hypothetical protein